MMLGRRTEKARSLNLVCNRGVVLLSVSERERRLERITLEEVGCTMSAR